MKTSYLQTLPWVFIATGLFSQPNAFAIQVAPYFYMWAQGNPSYAVISLMDAKAKSGLSAATLAFEIGDGACNPFNAFGVDQMLPDIQSFRSSGGELILSIG